LIIHWFIGSLILAVIVRLFLLQGVAREAAGGEGVVAVSGASMTEGRS
jgi:hypothetical protein